MTLVAVGFFLLGFVASWVAGRYVSKGAMIVQSGALGLCGLAALVIGMPGVIEANFVWALIALVIYGLIGALIFRAAQASREGAE
ncbi:hypothetical protein [Hasllibacter sp. MH4015]|uniref:hypothetical protein n=1 Tax=Hasllibacter sp. MH4015 TaxID=2854029 RepID=UPI001CD7AFF1|nr:hypothetical protein [Hasllibacter sp. MH4015]